MSFSVLTETDSIPGAPKQVTAECAESNVKDGLGKGLTLSFNQSSTSIKSSRDLQAFQSHLAWNLAAEAESLCQTLYFLQVCLLQVFCLCQVFFRLLQARLLQVFFVFYKRAFSRSCRLLQAFRSCQAFYRSTFDSCGVLVGNTLGDAAASGQ